MVDFLVDFALMPLECRVGNLNLLVPLLRMGFVGLVRLTSGLDLAAGVEVVDPWRSKCMRSTMIDSNLASRDESRDS